MRNIFIFIFNVCLTDDGPKRRFRWRHNEPKEDPLARRNFKGLIYDRYRIYNIKDNIYQNNIYAFSYEIYIKYCNLRYYIYILASVDGTCNEELVFEFPTSGQIATPNFENNYYGNDTDCTWEISTRKLTENKGQTISIF